MRPKWPDRVRRLLFLGLCTISCASPSTFDPQQPIDGDVYRPVLWDTSDESYRDTMSLDATDVALDTTTSHPWSLANPTEIAGPFTLDEWGASPFLSPSPDLDLLSLPSFSVGRELFVATWTPTPGSKPTIDGLGPVFNAPACLTCHPANGRPPSLAADGSINEGVLLRLAIDNGPHPEWGMQLQPQSIPGVPAEPTPRWYPGDTLPAFADVHSRSPRPSFTFDPPISPVPVIGARQAPHLAGMGLLEAVPVNMLAEWNDPDDSDGDGISGRLAVLETGAIGRFGWKAVHPTLRTQTASAFAADMGITSVEQPADDCTEKQPTCVDNASSSANEVSSDGLDAVASFMRHLGVPRARYIRDDPAVQKGFDLFINIQCAACHRPTLQTAKGELAVSNIQFNPFTDLLLHDMGDGLSESLPEGDAAPNEWRTPPLWGLGLVASSKYARFLHDGRAKTLADAIEWHGGEAENSRAAFLALSTEDRSILLTFLQSL